MLAKSKLLILTLLTLLNTAVFAAVDTQYSATMCGAQKYLFGCQVLTPAEGSGEYTNTLGDSTVHLNLLFGAAKATAYTATIEPGQKYLFGCQVLESETTVSNTLQQSGCACDSTVTLTLKVQAAPVPVNIAVSYSATIEKGDTYLFGCEQLTAEGSFSRTIPRIGGGDSTITVNLSYAAVPSLDIAVSYDAEIESGDTYLFGCEQLTAEGSFSRTIPRIGGGDSTITVNLSFAAVPSLDIAVSYDAEIESGDTYLFGCEQLTAEGSFSRTIPRIGGGDSTITVNLSYASVPPVPQDITVQYDAAIWADRIYLFGCKTYEFSDTGLYTLTDTLPRANGGDSIIIVNLSVGAGGGGEGDTIKVAYEAEIDEGDTYLFGCRALTEAGLYSDTLYSAWGGGDSVVFLTLKYPDVPQPDSVKVAYTASIEKGDTYLFGCDLYTTAGIYTNTLQRANGGDSIIILTLNVKDVVYGDTAATECDSLIWYEHSIYTSGDYVHTFTDGVRDSIVTMHATIKYSTMAAEMEFYEGCDFVVVRGKTYNTSGLYTDTLTNAVGCDSIITMNITVNYPSVGFDMQYGCDSVIYKGIKFFADTTFSDTITGGAASGCDSITLVMITVNHSSVGDTTANECDMFTWHGNTYYTSGLYKDTLTNLAGCDSIVTLHLTIRHSTTGDTTAVECDEFTWYGVTYTESAEPTHTFENAAGCDSVVTLHLTINHTAVAVPESADQCNYYDWHGVRYTETGTYYDTLWTVDGCDSICQLNLTISVPFDTTLSLIHKFGDRLLMINRNEINQKDGWLLDSLGLEHPEYVTWYEIDLNGNTKVVGQGYYYTLPNGEPLPSGYTYYAVINIAPSAGEKCGARGETAHYTIPAHGAPALLPSLARPGQGIQVVNLVPEEETVIRVFSADGQLLKTYTTTDAETFMIEAEYNNGFYMVELRSNYIKTTLRYIVK